MADPSNPSAGNAGSGSSDRLWLTTTLEARSRAHEAAAPDGRAIAAVRFARALTWSGDDVAAAHVLVAERRLQRKRHAKAESARCELGLAEIALVGDDEDRAMVHLDAARDAPAEELPTRQLLAGWVAARRGAALPFPELPRAAESPWIQELADSVALELLWSQAPAAAQLQPRGTDLRTRALVELHDATRGGDASSVKRALRTIEKAGLTRDLGRCVLRILASGPELLVAIGGTATSWVATAQSAIGDAQTWRDRVAVRHAWRVHGRRDADKALPREVAVRLDARDRMRAHVQSTLAIGLDRQAKAVDELEASVEASSAGISPKMERNIASVRDAIDLLDAATDAALGELGRVEGDLAQIVASTFAERERARAIAAVIAALEATEDVDTLVQQLAGVVGEHLQANAVVIAERVPYVGLRAIVARDIDPEDQFWIDAAESALDQPVGSTRPSDPARPDADRRGGSEVPPAGPVLVVPMRASGTDGAIYVDKRASGGAFTANDQATLELLASYGGLALARLRATNASSLLGRKLAAIIDAMRDGVLALDQNGVVTAINEPATRALRVDGRRLLNRKLEDIPELAPLAATLALPERPDGVVVRLPHASVVVHAREIEGEGIVATLIEYERAQKMAQKLVGGRTRYTFADLRGRDPALREAIEMARRAAAVDASVLIVGESGTGKELIAQAIHSGGPRSREPFIAINCAALPRELLEAELFGYERGAFTGARQEGSVGKFELAGDGTILLDEIVDMPLDMQAKLLRVLQERVVVRLGSSVERPVRARVLATAQRDLAIDVERGRFRLDLLHRLRVLQIVLPPLRQRPTDVGEIARHYIRQFAERQGKAVKDLAPEVESQLAQYSWPGNVRELANVIEGEVSLLAPDALVLEQVPASIARALYAEPAPSSGAWSMRDSSMMPGAESVHGINLRESTHFQIPSSAQILPLAEVERRAYLDAYDKSQRSVTRAAKALGVSKVTFYGKLRQFGMHPSEATGEVPAYRSTSKIPVADPYSPPESTNLAIPDSNEGPYSTRDPAPGRPSSTPRTRR
jgi:sigma-54 dependent transcriptional regulator, acetoin dehydrogenase operon transcriptional activator AcoR